MLASKGDLPQLGAITACCLHMHCTIRYGVDIQNVLGVYILRTVPVKSEAGGETAVWGAAGAAGPTGVDAQPCEPAAPASWTF